MTLSAGDEARRGLQAALAGLVAGCMLALSLLHVHMSHYALNDAPASAFLAGSLLFGTRAIAGGRRDLLLAGLLAGLAFTTKYNFGVILLLPLAVAMVVRPQSEKAGAAVDAEAAASGLLFSRRLVASWGNWARGCALRIGLVIGAFIVGALLSMPEITLTPGVLAASVAEQARLGTMRWSGQSAAPIVQLYFETLVHGLGWPVLLAAVVGAVSLARRDRTALVVQLAVPIGCLLVMLRQELFFARFALPLLPSLTIFAGLGLVEITTRAVALAARGQGASAMTDRRKHVRSSIVVVAATVTLLVVTLAPVTASTIRHNQLATTTDTRVQARQWLNRNVSRGRVVTETYGVPIAWSGGERSRRYQLQRSSTLINPTTVTRHACEGARYFLVASLMAERELAQRSSSARETGYDLLARTARPVATFDPFWSGATAPAHPDNTGIPFWYLEAYARPGPKITVYELPEGAVNCTR